MLVPALLAALVPFVPGQEGDPLTGVWEGRGKGDDALIPPEGFGFTLVLEAQGEDEALATLTMEGVPSARSVTASFDAENGELAFRCDLLGILVDVEVVLAADELSGTAAGLGIEVALAGKRTARALPSKPAPEAPRAPVDLATLTSADWRADLAHLAETLPQAHANAFHTLAREEWEERVRALDARLAELGPAASAVALAQLVAAVGDAHTELGLGGKPFDRFLPVRFGWFADGVFVIAVDGRFEALLGGRVRRIGRLAVDDALAVVRSTFAAENDAWPRAKTPPRLAQPALLAALGVTESADSIPVVVAGTAGEDVAVTIDGSGGGKWLVAPDAALVATPLWLQRRNETYWFAPLEPEKAVYLAYNRCAEDPARPMAGFMAEVLATLERTGAERLVIDLRHNSGGNSAVLGRFVPELTRHPRFAEPGRVRVLIGVQTFSSGTRNAQELRDGASARLFGEPTGGKPNSYGEVRVFHLPRSGLAVYHSTKLFRDLATDPPAVEPDVLVPLGSADYFAGVDPVLERALGE